jgi:hypothetical protein
MRIETFVPRSTVSIGMEEAIFVLVGFAIVGAIIVFSLNNRFRIRELDHKEKLAAIEKGVDPPARQSAPWTTRTYLLHGMIWLFAGLATFVALSAIASTSHHPMPVEARIAAVNDARFRGATPAELEMLLHAPREEEGIPIGIGFLGLIPVGVGLAYLIFYRIESRKLLS